MKDTADNKKNDIIELKKNIYQLGARCGGCKVYLVKGTRKNLLIDSGLPSDFEILDQQLKTLGLSLPISRSLS